MNRLTCGLLLMVMPLGAQAVTPEDWQTWLDDTPAFHSRVEQSRWLPEAEIRVHADGEILFTPMQSLAWHWATPQPRIVTLDVAGRFVELTPDVPELSATPLDEAEGGLPEERQVAQLLWRLLQGDLAPLRKQYHLLLDGEREDWQLILLPRERSEDALRKIAVEGGRFIESLRFVASGGNELTMTLSDIQTLVDAQGAQRLQESLAAETDASAKADTESTATTEASASPGKTATDGDQG